MGTLGIARRGPAILSSSRLHQTPPESRARSNPSARGFSPRSSGWLVDRLALTSSRAMLRPLSSSDPKPASSSVYSTARVGSKTPSFNAAKLTETLMGPEQRHKGRRDGRRGRRRGVGGAGGSCTRSCTGVSLRVIAAPLGVPGLRQAGRGWEMLPRGTPGSGSCRVVRLPRVCAARLARNARRASLVVARCKPETEVESLAGSRPCVRPPPPHLDLPPTPRTPLDDASGSTRNSSGFASKTSCEASTLQRQGTCVP